MSSRDRSIAVLPFANMSGDPENEYFSDGITEEIINALSQLPRLRVAARTSAFSFKGKNVDLRSIGEQLRVATVLEGSVRRAGRRIRITAQLINVSDGYHLWSERYDRELTDIFAIQDEIATAIAGAIQGDAGGKPGAEPRASADYQRRGIRPVPQGARVHEAARASLLRAVECFEQAIAGDPQFALAHAELAEALALMSLYGIVSPSETRQRASLAIARAQQLDPRLVSTQIGLGLYSIIIEFDRAAAREAFARAIELRSAGRRCPAVSGGI